MKLQDFLKCLFLAMFSLVVTTLENEKSFLMQDSASNVMSIAIYENSLLITVSNDIVQKDIQTGAIQRTFRAHRNTIYSFVVTEDSRMISSAYDDMIVVWNLETGSILKRIMIRSTGTLMKSIYYKADQVFAGGLDEIVRQIDLASGRIVKTISVVGKVYSVAATEDSIFVGKTLSPHVVKLDIKSGATILRLNEHSGTVYSLFVWNNLVFSGSHDATIICWKTLNGEIIQTYVGHSDAVYSVAVFDAELYSSASETELFKWNIESGMITKKFTVDHTNEIFSLAYKSGDLFTGSYDATVIRQNSITGNVLFSYTGRKSVIWSIVSWKNYIFSGGDDAEIRMWDASIDSKDPFAVFDNSRARIAVVHIFEGFMYCGDFSTVVKMMNLSSLIVIRTYANLGEPILSFAADKFSLYGGGFYGSIYQWNTTSGNRTGLIRAHSDRVLSLQLSDDILYSGSFDTSATAWRTKSLQSVRVYDVFGQITAILIEQEFLIACTLQSVEKFSVISGVVSVYLEGPSPCLCLVSRGNTVFTGHEDSLIRVRDSNSLNPYNTYIGHLDAVNALCFDEVLNLYSAGFDGTIKKWNEASRSVAYSFENRNGSVSSLAVYHSKLFVGLKSGRIDCYNTDNAMALDSLRYHTKTVSSLIAYNNSIYSSSFDGTVLQFPSTGNGSLMTVYKSHQEPLNDLSLTNSFWFGLQSDTNIVLGPLKMNPGSIRVIEFQTPLVCLAATESLILAGSKSGIIYSWAIETMKLEVELKGHISPVNNLLVVDDRFFSASDDKTIIEWSMGMNTATRAYKRLSATALGHLGPVNSLSVCSETLFSAGSDLTVRRWNTKTGRHDDVYFGFTKSVTSVLCYNGSVFAGSEDFSVLMFKPSLPENQDAAVKPSTTSSSRTKNQKKVLRRLNSESASMNVPVVIVSVAGAVVAIMIVIFGYLYMKQRSKKIISPPDKTTSIQETASTETITDLQTVVNSVMGISKHAAYLLENSVFAKVKRLTAGGGGEVFLAKIMDAHLAKKYEDTVIQKVVFMKNKLTEEAFYQEVGIMILLNPFPHFCSILGYTEKPLSIILKYYPDGSLNEWVHKNKPRKSSLLKIVKEISEALNTMHSHYLAHCDIKPQNILLQVENGIPTCYLTDFGITQVLSDKILASRAFNVINLRGLSIHYAAPDAFTWFRTKSAHGVDFKKFDVYSFSCIVLEILSRRSPWS